MSDPTLAGHNLGGDPVWIDRLSRVALRQSEKPTLGGGMAVYQQPLRGGLPITLECYLPDATVRALGAFRDEGATMILDLPGLFTGAVLFRHEGGAPIEAEPLAGWYADPADEDLFFCTLRLMEA